MTTVAKKGDWVQIHEIVLKPEQRTGKLPEDTQKVPLELWVKGFISNDANIGETVEIKTITGRVLQGELVEVNPRYEYGFGDTYVPEVLQIGLQIRSILKDGEN